MVSHACIFLTKLLLSISFLIENERLKVTAKGKPSGIATTIIDTHKITLVIILLIKFDQVNSSSPVAYLTII